MRVSCRLLALVALGWSLAGCSGLAWPDQPASDEQLAYSLDEVETIGQSFVAREAGLAGVEVFLWPQSRREGDIRLRLRADALGGSADDLAVSTIPLQSVTSPGFYRFSFLPQPDSRQRSYYVALEVVGEGDVWVGSAPGEAYLEGALYRNGSPGDTQMTFRLVYEPTQVVRGVLSQGVSWVWYLTLAGLLFVVPGWALLTSLWPKLATLPWLEKLGLSAGLSLAVYPILFLWTDLAGVHLGPLYAWLPVASGLAALAWRLRVNWQPVAVKTVVARWFASEHLWPDLAFIGILGLVFLGRFEVARSLEAPLWGDSYQHTMIAQLLVDNGGLFDTWQPYAAMQTFTYHFGYHTAVAAFHWLSGLNMPDAVLWSGQMLNGLAVVALCPLAMRVGGSRWAGVGAVLVAGLLSPMPMFYVNWGRYTQLAGQAILPAAVYLPWLMLETKSRNWGGLILIWIALAGLALTHYRVLVVSVLFIGAYLILRLGRGQLRFVLSEFLWIASGATVLFFPWFVHMFAGKIVQIFAHQMTTLPGTASIWAELNTIGDFSLYPAWFWLPALLSLGWGLWRRERGAAVVGIWCLLLLLAANPQWLRLPGEGALSNFALFIAAYIPASLVVGGALGWLASEWSRPVAPWLCLLVIALGLWGARQRTSDLRVAQSALVTRPDRRAAAWIRDHTSPEARFLVNSFFAYGNSLIVGSDSGWWLPLLAGRDITVPPINYGSEQGPRPDYQEWINALPLEIQQKGLTHPDVEELLAGRGITHVYIGQRQGRVNYAGPHVLRPDELLASTRFRPVYHQDRVWIFEVLP